MRAPCYEVIAIELDPNTVEICYDEPTCSFGDGWVYIP